MGVPLPDKRCATHDEGVHPTIVQLTPSILRHGASNKSKSESPCPSLNAEVLYHAGFGSEPDALKGVDKLFVGAVGKRKSGPASASVGLVFN